MMLNRFRPISGIRAAASALLTVGLLASCNYGFTGGGGFPSDIRTLFIQPFENQTPQFELEQQLFSKLQEKLPRALGVRPGSEANADAMVSGRITTYQDAAANYRPGG